MTSFEKQFDQEKLTRLDPIDVYNYVSRFAPKDLTSENILAIFEQISAFDLLKFYISLGASSRWSTSFVKRIATIDAYEFAVICYLSDKRWLPASEVNFNKSFKIFDKTYAHITHNDETIEYWQDLQTTIGLDAPYLSHSNMSFNLDEYFRRFSFPTNQLIIFATKQPGFAKKYSQLSPELQAKYCHPKDVAKHFSMSLPQHIRLGLLFRENNLQELLQSIPHMSLSSLERTFIDASNNRYKELPQVVVDEIENLLRAKNDELYIVKREDLVDRFLLKRATMRDLDYVITFAYVEDLLRLPNSLLVFEKICLLRSDLGSYTINKLMSKYPNLSQDQLLLLIKNQDIEACADVVTKILDNFGSTRQLVDLLIKKHVPETIQFISFDRWDSASRMRYLESTFSKIIPADINVLFEMDRFSDQEQLAFVTRTCELCETSVFKAIEKMWRIIRGTMGDNQQVCSYLCNKFPTQLGKIFHQFTQFGKNGTDLFPLVDNDNFVDLFQQDFDDAESLVRRIMQVDPDLQSNLLNSDMSDANVLIWLDYCEPEYVADIWSENHFENIVAKLPNEEEANKFAQNYIYNIANNTAMLSQIFEKMSPIDAARLLARKEITPRVRRQVFMKIVERQDTRLIDYLFVSDFLFLLLEAKAALIAINPVYGAKIDAIPRNEPMAKRFRII